MPDPDLTRRRLVAGCRGGWPEPAAAGRLRWWRLVEHPGRPAASPRPRGFDRRWRRLPPPTRPGRRPPTCRSAAGVILHAQNIVVTQPTKGTFEGFTATCTHQGCLLANVAAGTINCGCHGSQFSITDGSNVTGPSGHAGRLGGRPAARWRSRSRAPTSSRADLPPVAMPGSGDVTGRLALASVPDHGEGTTCGSLRRIGLLARPARGCWRGRGRYDGRGRVAPPSRGGPTVAGARHAAGRAVRRADRRRARRTPSRSPTATSSRYAGRSAGGSHRCARSPDDSRCPPRCVSGAGGRAHRCRPARPRRLCASADRCGWWTDAHRRRRRRRCTRAAAPAAAATPTAHQQFVAALDNKGALGQDDTPLLGHVSRRRAPTGRRESNGAISAIGVPATVAHYDTARRHHRLRSGRHDFCDRGPGGRGEVPGLRPVGGGDQLVLFVPTRARAAASSARARSAAASPAAARWS